MNRTLRGLVSSTHIRMVVLLAVAALVAALAPATALGTVTTFDGHVTNASGVALPGVNVSWQDANQNFSDSQSTDATGAWTSIIDDGGSDGPASPITITYSDPAKLRVTKTEDVAFTLGGTKSITAALATAGVVTGRLVDVHGTPIEGVTADLVSLDQQSYLDNSTTGADGRFTLGSVDPGQYLIWFSDDSHDPAQWIEKWYGQTDSQSDPVPVLASSPAHDLGDVALERTVVVSGTVTDQADAPLEGANVTVYRQTGSGQDAEWDYDSSTNTDADGTYQLPAQAGTLTVEFDGPTDVNDQPLFVSQWWNNQGTADSATEHKTAPGDTWPGVNAKLTAVGHITGRVTNHAGTPLANIAVSVWDGVSPDAPVQIAPEGQWNVQDVTTSVDGTYSVPVLGNGHYSVYFSDNADTARYSPSFYVKDNGNDTAIERSTLVTTTVGATTAGIDEALYGIQSISGTVKSSSGVALKGVDVIGRSQSWSYNGNDGSGSVRTDKFGKYKLTGISANTTYTVEFTPSSSSYLTAYWNNKSEWDRVNLAWTSDNATPLRVGTSARNGVNASLKPSGRVSGVVKDSHGKPVAGARVIGSMLVDTGNEDEVGSAITDKHGRYTVKGFETGIATVWATDSAGRFHRLGYKTSGQALYGSGNAYNLFTTAGKTVSAINFKLAPAGRLTGKVTDATSGKAVADTGVTLFKKSASGSWEWTDYETTSKSGAYAFGELDSGYYRVRFEGNLDTDNLSLYAPQYYKGSGTSVGATAIHVTSGVVKSGINAALAKGGSISGTMRGIGGVGVEGTVYAYDAKDPDISYRSDSDSSLTGTYAISFLPAGSYKIRFYTDETGYAPQWYGGAHAFSQSPTITLAAKAAVKSIDTTLGHGASLDFTFVNAKGEPVGGEANASSTDVGGNEWDTRVGSDGHGTATDVEPGHYTVKFDADGGDDQGYARWTYPGVAEAAAGTLTVAADTSVEGTVALAGNISGHAFGPGGIAMGPRRVTAGLYMDLGAKGWQSISSWQQSESGYEWQSENSGYLTSTGGFGFRDLLPGMYKLVFKDLPGVFKSTWYGSASSQAGATIIEVKPGESHVVAQMCNLDSTKLWLDLSASPLAPAKGKTTTLTAVVRDTHGWPTALRTVSFFRASSSAGPWTLQGTGVTDSFGSCSVKSSAVAKKRYFKAVYSAGAVRKTSPIRAVSPK